MIILVAVHFYTLVFADCEMLYFLVTSLFCICISCDVKK